MIGSIADRMLAIFVPRATAAAACVGSWKQLAILVQAA
jgi:hypothetical protein